MTQTPQPQQTAAFFDLDRTLVQGSSLLALGWPLYRGGFIKANVLIRSTIHQLLFAKQGATTSQLDDIATQLRPIMQNINVSDLQQTISQSIEKYIVPRFLPKSIAILREHQRRGDLVFIISAAPKEIVEPIATYLGIDGVIATELEVVNGKYSGNLNVYCHGDIKRQRIEEIAQQNSINLPNSSAYSDGITDLPMLEAVGHPVCVNPDKELRAIAQKRHWRIIKCAMPRRYGLSKTQLRQLHERSGNIS